MLRRICLAATAAFIVIGSVAQSQLAAESDFLPRITLDVSSKKLVAYDPLVVRVTMENLEKSPIVLHQQFSAATGWVRFERRFEGYAWHTIETLNAGREQAHTMNPPQLLPGERIAAYEVLFYQRREAVFSASGKQEIRAFVGNDERRWESEPVAIEVASPAANREKDVMEASQGLRQVVTSEGVSTAVQIDDLTRWESRIGESELRTTLRLTIANHTFWKAADSTSRESAAAHLKRFRAELGSIQNNFLALHHAREYCRQRNWDAAIDEISSVKVRTSNGESLRRFAEYWKKHAEDKAKAANQQLKPAD